MEPKPYKIVVFDLDETLGYFQQLGGFCNILQKYYKIKLSQMDFNILLDLYPEFLRPNIIPILQYLKHKKREKRCFRIMIYTNNKAPKHWAEKIKNYFNYKLNYSLFDKIIGAFKVNGKIIESNRTTTQKTVDDFFRCTKLPKTTEICFIDDKLFKKMITKNVYYVHLQPYVFMISNQDMIQRYIKSSICKKMITDININNNLLRLLENNNILINHINNYEIHKIISKKIIYHLQLFFNKSFNSDSTRKNNQKKKTKNKTVKFFQ